MTASLRIVPIPAAVDPVDPRGLLDALARRLASRQSPLLRTVLRVDAGGRIAGLVSNGTFAVVWRDLRFADAPRPQPGDFAHAIAAVVRRVETPRARGSTPTADLREALALPATVGAPCPVCRDTGRFCPSCGAWPDAARDASDQVWTDPLWIAGVPVNRVVLRAALGSLPTVTSTVGIGRWMTPREHGVVIITSAWRVLALGLRVQAPHDYEGAPRYPLPPHGGVA